MFRGERRISSCRDDGPLKKCLVHYGFSKFQICYFSDFADFVERLENPHGLATIPAVKASGVATEAKKPEEICEKSESIIDSGSRIADKAPLEEGRTAGISLGGYFLSCVWPSNRDKPSWFFVDVAKKVLVVLKTDIEEKKLKYILLGSPILGSPKDAKLKVPTYKIVPVVSIIIDPSSLENLEKKINGGLAEKLTADEYRLATHIVIQELVNEIINDHIIRIEGLSNPLKLSDIGLFEKKECYKLATYIAGLAPREDEKFAKLLISVIKSPKLFEPRPASSRPFAPPVSPRPRSNSSASLPNSPHCPQSPLGKESRYMSYDLSGTDDTGKISIWQKFKLIYEKWRVLPLRYKIAAVTVVAIGGGAIVYGSVFCPPIAILVPFIGILNAPAIAIIGGAIVASIASIVHAFHVAFTNVNHCKIEGEENYGTNCYGERKFGNSLTRSSSLVRINEAGKTASELPPIVLSCANKGGVREQEAGDLSAARAGQEEAVRPLGLSQPPANVILPRASEPDIHEKVEEGPPVDSAAIASTKVNYIIGGDGKRKVIVPPLALGSSDSSRRLGLTLAPPPPAISAEKAPEVAIKARPSGKVCEKPEPTIDSSSDCPSRRLEPEAITIAPPLSPPSSVRDRPPSPPVMISREKKTVSELWQSKSKTPAEAGERPPVDLAAVAFTHGVSYDGERKSSVPSSDVFGLSSGGSDCSSQRPGTGVMTVMPPSPPARPRTPSPPIDISTTPKGYAYELGLQRDKLFTAAAGRPSTATRARAEGSAGGPIVLHRRRDSQPSPVASRLSSGSPSAARRDLTPSK